MKFVCSRGSQRQDRCVRRAVCGRRAQGGRSERAAAIAGYRAALDALGSKTARLERLDQVALLASPTPPVICVIGSDTGQRLPRQAALTHGTRLLITVEHAANVLRPPTVVYLNPNDRDTANQIRIQPELTLTKAG